MNGEEKSIVERELGLLDTHYGMLRKVARETIETLGEEAIGYWVDAYNTCIDIESAIMQRVPEDILLRSLLHLRLVELYKEMSWLRFLFLAGNYPMLARELRFTWEAISQAYYLDSLLPELGVDEKTAKLSKKKYRGWRMIKEVLPDVLPAWTEELGSECRRLYDHLSEMIHPTRQEFDLKVLEGSGALLVTDTFVESIALETLDMAERVFDIVWCTAFAEYPRLSVALERRPYLVDHLESFCPQTCGWLQRLSDGPALKGERE